MTTVTSVSLSPEHQEHCQHTVSLGLVLKTSPWHHDSDTRCSLRSQDLTLITLGDSHPLPRRPQHTVVSQH